jgi:hypothetical protein
MPPQRRSVLVRLIAELTTKAAPRILNTGQAAGAITFYQDQVAWWTMNLGLNLCMTKTRE